MSGKPRLATSISSAHRVTSNILILSSTCLLFVLISMLATNKYMHTDRTYNFTERKLKLSSIMYSMRKRVRHILMKACCNLSCAQTRLAPSLKAS